MTDPLWRVVVLWVLPLAPAVAAPPLADPLAAVADRVVCESYVDDNWELAVVNADGSGHRLLTNTPDVHELYPQASPDGKRIAFLVDSGSGRDTVRSLWVMDADGSNRRKIADRARQPTWSPDNRTLAYLPQEFAKWNIVDYYSKGLVYHDVETGESRPHPNASQLHHLYNPSFAPNGRWIAATVHAGMGHGHTNLLIEAEGDRIIDLGIGGCRPCLAPDGRRIAWGLDDHTIQVRELDLDAETPALGEVLMEVHDPNHKLYHVDWSPDGRFLSLSRGPTSNGDLTKPGTHEAACEMVGVYAAGWDIFVVPAEGHRKIDLTRPDPATSHRLTSDGRSNKESDWIKSPR